MFRATMLPLLVICATQVQAEADLCPMTDEQDNCVRIIACIGEQGRWFHGCSFRRGEGTLAGMINDGVACNGTWTHQNVNGGGQADVTCDDGMSVSVLYFHQDAYTGTAKGRGMSNRGEVVEAWSGTHVLEYFRDGDPSAEAILQCGDFGIPIS